jgi:hypothetical protein
MTDANTVHNAQIRVAEEQMKQTEDSAKEGARAFGRTAHDLGSAVELWAEQVQQQHNALRKFVEGSFGSYMQLLNTPASYLSQQAEQQQQQLQQTFQQVAQQFVPQPQQQQQHFEQFQDMASQLVAHTHSRLRSCADRLARDTMGDDEDGEAVVESGPLRPNPVTQDEMDAGSVELF